MFSFLKKKSSPNTPPEEQDIIPGPDAPSSNGDGFVIINRENTNTPTSNLYPPMPAMPINPIPKLPPVHYLQGVPFKISAELENTNSFESKQLEIDGILALMTKRLQFEEDYDFSLEREIVSQ